MRKNKLFDSLIWILILSIVGGGCKKEEKITHVVVFENVIKNKPIEEQRKYVYEHFKIITKEVAKAMKAPKVKRLVDEEALKMKSGDYNVLIKDLLTNPLFASNVDTKILQVQLDAFKGIVKKDLQPHIYVPRFAKSKKSAVLSNNVDNSSIEWVITDGDESIVELPAWESDDNGELELNGRIINERYAENNTVYLINFNESDNDYGGGGNYSVGPNNHLPPTILAKPPVNPPVNPADINIRLDEIKIKEMNESWVNGKPEITIMGRRYTWNGKLDGDPTKIETSYSSDIFSNTSDGNLIFCPDRCDVNNGVTFSVNYNLQKHWLINMLLPKNRTGS